MEERLKSLWQPIHHRILLMLLFATILLLIPLPRAGREFDALGDLAHAPLFGVLAALLFLWGRAWLPHWNLVAALCVWIAVSVMGIGVEFIQSKLTRFGSWSDAYANMLGAAAFLIWCLAYSWKGIMWRAVGIIIGISLLFVAWLAPMVELTDAVIQRYEMPLLASFEHKFEFSRWQFNNSRIAQTSSWATDGKYSLLLDMQPAKYPSAMLYWPVADWSGYGTLTFDVMLSGSEPLPIVVKIEDHFIGREVEDRYNGQFLLQPGGNTIRINLWDVAIAPKNRTLNLQDIRRLQIFTVNLKEPRRLLIDNMRLRP